MKPEGPGLLLELLHHADARVDDEALLAGGRGHDIAVGGEGLGGESEYEHRVSLLGGRGRAGTGRRRRDRVGRASRGP